MSQSPLLARYSGQPGSASRSFRFRATYRCSRVRTTMEMLSPCRSAMRDAAHQMSPSMRTFRCFFAGGATPGDVTGVGPRSTTTVIPASLLAVGPNVYPLAACTEDASGIRLWGIKVFLNSTEPRSRLSQHHAGFRRNQPFSRTVAKMTLASIAANRAEDVTYSVLCGTCSDALGEPRTATHVIGYDSTDLDGEPIGERLYTCVPCFGETYVWAEAQNRSFVPPTIDRIKVEAPAPVSTWVPRCAFCASPYYECQTDSRGLCVAGSVSA